MDHNNLPTVSARARLSRLAKWTARATGRRAAFGAAVGISLIWISSGPFFGIGNTRQLMINIGTTIVTFLMVLLIQNTRNIDSEAMQVKLDELIRFVKEAHKALFDREQAEEVKPDFNSGRVSTTGLAHPATSAATPH
ncbi:MAG: low affinity iron permease family protein [Azonexus sp.]|nr:low affinity iron permease family protein [Azonexus sp.]